MVRNSPDNAGNMRPGFDPLDEKISWRRAQQPTPAFLPGESRGERSLVDYSPWGHKEWGTTEHADNNSKHLPVSLTVFIIILGYMLLMHAKIQE